MNMSIIKIVNINSRETVIRTLDVDGSVLESKTMQHEDAMNIAAWHVKQFGPKSVVGDYPLSNVLKHYDNGTYVQSLR